MKNISKEEIKKRLKEILCEKESQCIAINGEWGIGKTYLWQEFSKEFNDKKCVYISLFGKSSVTAIEQHIAAQIYKINKIIDDIQKGAEQSKAREVFDSFVGHTLGSAVFGIMSFLKRDDFKDIVICFDDFERISEELRLNDLFGLMSDLKEQKNCHIVMILNKDKLKDKEEIADVLSKYTDKIINYNLNYNPTPKESFEIASKDLKSFQNYVLEYFERHAINNIRIMKRVINALKDYAFVEEFVKGHREVENEVVKNILEIATINSIDMLVNFDELHKYSSDLLIKDSESKIETNDKFDKLLYYIDSGYFMLRDITDNIIFYVKNSITDKEWTKNIIDDMIKNEQYNFIQQELKNCLSRSEYDFNYSFSQFSKDVFKILQDNEEKIPKVVSAIDFIFYISCLEGYKKSSQNNYHKFAIKILKQYIDNADIGHRNMYPVKRNINEILKFDNELKEYFDSLISKSQNEKLSSSKAIINIILDIFRNGGIGEEAKILTSIDENKLKEYILNDPDFVEHCIDLIREFNFEQFKPFKENFINIINSIANDGSKDRKRKAKNILKHIDKDKVRRIE